MTDQPEAIRDGAAEGQQPGEAIHLPKPSIWPVIFAAAIALLLFGVVTSYALSAVGGLLLVWAVGGWVQELRHE